jgi:hypothetical protein
MYSKIKDLNPLHHHFDLVNQVILISLLSIDKLNLEELSSSSTSCLHRSYEINGMIFLIFKLKDQSYEINSNCEIEHSLIAQSVLIPSFIVKGLLSSFTAV